MGRYAPQRARCLVAHPDPDRRSGVTAGAYRAIARAASGHAAESCPNVHMFGLNITTVKHSLAAIERKTSTFSVWIGT
jgi:hypothetical protein